MATNAKSIKKTTTQPKASTKEVVVEEVVEKSVPAKTAKKPFDNTDMITCRSITYGELLFVGPKTNTLYSWADYGDEVEIEYQDLIYAVRSNSPMVYKPRFVVVDEEFLAENPKLDEFYNAMYSVGDFEEILALPVNEMRMVIASLPEGARDSLKTMIASQVTSGQLDSVNKIKALDEIFDVKFSLLTGLYE